VTTVTDARSQTPNSAHRRRDRTLTAGFVAIGLLLGGGLLQAKDTTPAADPAAVESAYQRGYEHQGNKQTDAAIAAYEQALALDPEHVASLYEIGWSYWVLGRWADVVRVWEHVLLLEPEHEEVPRYIEEARTKAELRRRLEAGPTIESGPETVARADGPGLRFALGGDTMMGSPLTGPGLPKNDGATLFDAYAESMKAADVTFLNLEGVLLDSGKSHKCPDEESTTCYAFRSPVRYAQNLVDAGVDVVSFANNHANDFGPAGRTSTVNTLNAAGIKIAGPLDQTAILEVGGARVGVLGFATSPLGGDVRDVDLAVAMVQEMTEKADLVVVSFHGGAEGAKAQRVPIGTETFLGENRGDVRRFAHAVIDAGADLIVGHGPHVLRGMEVYKERLIAYSLGNFVTYGGFSLRGMNGLSVLVEVDLHPDGRLAAGRIISGRQIPPGGPLLDPEAEAVAVIRELSTVDFGETALKLDDDGRFAP
jgi:hypothetical protein